MKLESMDKDAMNGVSWRSIPGYEDYFSISSEGEIRAKPKVVKTPKGLVLYRGGLQPKKQIVDLDKEGRGVELLHGKEPINNRNTDELILLSFRGPPLSKRFKLKHRDGNPANFSLPNLVWTTPKAKQSSYGRDFITFEMAQTDWLLELLGPELKPIPEPEYEQLIQEPIEGWINRYLARYPIAGEEKPDFTEWPEPLTNWEELYLSLVAKYDTDIQAQNERILTARSRIQELRQGLRSQMQELYAEIGSLFIEIDELEYQIAVMEEATLRVSTPRLKLTAKLDTRLRLTDTGVQSLSKTRLTLTKALSKIPREKMTNGILFDQSA